MRLFYGWVIVAVGIAVTCVGMGCMLSLGVFLQPISAEMGWSRAGVSAASMLNFLSMGVASLAWGALTDRYGARLVVLAGGALLGIGLTAASQATTLLEFQLLFGIIVGVAVGSAYAPLVTTTSGWFTRHRSLAVALVSIGLGMGSMIIAPLASWVIDGHGWRTALWVLGLVAWSVVMPAALLLRKPPEETLAPGAVAEPDSGFTVARALRTPQFAAIALTHFCCCAAHSGPIFHMVSYAMSCGVPALTATTVFSVAGLGGLFGRIVCGLLADRFGAKLVLAVGLAMQALGISLYLVATDLERLYALSLLFGFAYGGVMPLYAILVRQYFGARIMGTTFGAVSMIATLGMAIGPLAGGWLFDTFVSYAWLYLGSCAFGLAAVAVALTFRPPRLLGNLAVAH